MVPDTSARAGEFTGAVPDVVHPVRARTLNAAAMTRLMRRDVVFEMILHSPSPQLQHSNCTRQQRIKIKTSTVRARLESALIGCPKGDDLRASLLKRMAG
jgi:hypothetical protein